jgi:two-component system phosphate regulon sensor histidine kinase PhoR
VETVAPRAAKRSVKLVPRIVPGLPPIVGDRHHLEAIFLNLLDNALRVSPDGGTITVRAEPGAGVVRFGVEDQGPGIPRELRDRVFERFYRLDTGRSTEEGGSGLGLAIVKHAVHLHGGEVWIEDGPGAGTHIAFTLPEAPPDALV